MKTPQGISRCCRAVLPIISENPQENRDTAYKSESVPPIVLETLSSHKNKGLARAQYNTSRKADRYQKPSNKSGEPQGDTMGQTS